MNLADSRHQDDLLLMLAAAVRVIGSVIAANTEVVLHDLRSPEFSIAEIANPHVTGRRRGDSVLAGLRSDKAFISAMDASAEPVTLMLDYPTYSSSGAPLRSSTAFYRTPGKAPFAALCINVDNQSISDALTILQSLTRTIPPQDDAPPRQNTIEAAHENIEDLMRDIITSATELSPGSSRADSKKARLLAVRQMQEKGIFLMKGGVEKAAAALGITRYTIYNYLDELKKSGN
ncbi:helix-turn-helix transcriptional regulator [Erwinia aphidicola]|uniref:helix-turn-helix transcriptional regulator n=1 Tax=Erwinia aphidicola TaxID=68334 RepID=UPI003CEBF29D